MIEFIKLQFGDKKKKYLIAGFFLLTVLLLAIYFILTYFTNKTDVILERDLTCDFREEVHVMDFVYKLNGEAVANSLVDTSEVGKKTISFTYRNRYGLIVSKKFKIEIKDVVSPTVVVNNPYIVEKGSINNLYDSIFCADDYDDQVTCSIVGKYDLEKVGKYDLKMIAVDHSGNSTTKEFTLQVVEPSSENDSSLKNQEMEYTSFESVYKKHKKDNTLIGLDLSKWQQEVDFAKLKEQGVSFVMLKIGGQKKIRDEFTIDPKFYDNIEKALENDIQVGVYFYSYATSEGEAKKQAKWIIQKLKDYDITLPIVFDWENWNNYTTFHLSFHTLNKIASAFMEEVERNGYSSMLYSSKYYLETIWYAKDYTNWLAYYTKNNDYQGEYAMWQVCSDGKIDGIDGYVDIDVMYLSS